MASRPSPAIPKRIQPLRWRRPAFVWVPIAVVLGLSWPAVLISGQAGLALMCLLAGAIGMAASLLALGFAWVIGRPPRTRNTVIRNVAWTAAIIAAASPFLLMPMLPSAVGGGRLSPAAPLAMAPLALMLGLFMGLFAGAVFSVVALVKPPRAAAGAPAAQAVAADPEPVQDVQPFY